MRLLTNRDGELSNCFGKFDESKNRFIGLQLYQTPNDKPEEVADRGKNKDLLPLEQIFGFFKTGKKSQEV